MYNSNVKNAVVYITRDIERALGAEPSPSYFIVANDGPYARSIKEKYPDFVMLLESPCLAGRQAVPLDTFEMLEKEETAEFIEKILKKFGTRKTGDRRVQANRANRRALHKERLGAFESADCTCRKDRK